MTHYMPYHIQTELGKIKVSKCTAHFPLYNKITSHFMLTILTLDKFNVQQKLGFFPETNQGKNPKPNKTHTHTHTQTHTHTNTK